MTTVEERYAEIEERIREACRRVGRSPDEVTLVGASKAQPVERLVAAVRAGLTVFGENRVQEAEAHRGGVEAELTAAETERLEWHLIGPLQSNKTRPAAELFHAFQAVSRLKIARRLESHLAELGRTAPAWVEVNLGGEESKHGFQPEGLEETVRPLADFQHLRLVGVMVIPPPGETPEDSRPWFRRAREVRDRLAEQPEWEGFPGLLSMGMSGDYAVAVEEGATHVRVGSALFGSRD